MRLPVLLKWKRLHNMSKVAIFSDVHANFSAMKVMMQHAHDQNVDEFISLGDLIGYGSQPIECLHMAKENLNGYWVFGNHEELWNEIRVYITNDKLIITEDLYCDLVEEKITIPQYWQIIKTNWVCGAKKYAVNRMINQLATYIYKSKGMVVKQDAIDAILRNRLELESEDPANDLQKWYFSKENEENHNGPRSLKYDGIQWIILHGSMKLPTEGYVYPWECKGFNDNVYIQQVEPVQKEYSENQEMPICVCSGHSHVPLYSPLENWEDAYSIDARKMCYGKELPLGQKLTLINPGSVGHPSDFDPRLSYAIVDTTRMTVIYYRLGYENQDVIKKLGEKLYPNKMASFIQHAECRAEDRNEREVIRFLENRMEMES